MIDETGAGVHVHVVGESGEHSGAPFDGDLEPAGPELCHGLGGQGYPVFAGRGLPGHAHTHAATECNGKGSGARAGTEMPVVRLAAYATAMEVCDPALGAHAARVAANAEAVAVGSGGKRSGSRPPARRRAPRRGQGQRPTRGAREAGTARRRRACEIRAHPVEGIWLLAGVPSLAPALPYVLFHHERWDGDGYPTRRAGASIPLEGRVLAVADAFDAMTSGRPYRPALLTADDAADEIRRCAGTQFDPDVAEAFLTALDAGEIVCPASHAAAAVRSGA